MFNLTRYYSIVSFFCIIIAAGCLGMFNHYQSIQSLKEISEDHNVALAQLFENSLWDHFSPLLMEDSASQLIDPASRDITDLHQDVVALMKGTSVVKVKVYNLKGVTVFSTETKQIGEDKHDNAGFLDAVQGRTVSQIYHRDKFNSFEGVIESRDLMSSYIPFMPGHDKSVQGVFELYTDITPFMIKVNQTKWIVIIAVVGILTLLYGVLYLVVFRAKLIIKEQEVKLANSLARIESDKLLLDERVVKRTQELQNTNRMLKSEISARQRVEEELRLSAKVFENTVEGVIITDSNNCILTVNNAFTHVTGYDQDEVKGLTPQIFHSGRHDAQFYAEMWESLKQNDQWIGEIWNKRKNGEIYPERLTISAVKDNNGVVGHYVAVFNDISDAKKSQDRLDFLAHHDPLTNLPNRLLFNIHLNHGIELARRDLSQMAVIFIDLDHFKTVNDSLGHDCGDELLKKVATVLGTQVRKSDTLARLGGDEFILLLNNIEALHHAGTIAEKFLNLLSQSFNVSGHEIFITASIGISFYPMDGEDASTLVKNADTAMYFAKTHNRNSYHFYSPSMGEHAQERIKIETLLRHSIDRGEMAVHYQPQVNLLTGQLVGMEALLRWNNPELGMLSPTRFISVAEDTGFIATLGEWVLRTACRQLKEWDSCAIVMPCVAVNLSVKQLEYSDIVGIVSRILAETGLPSSRLELEVTESSVMNNQRALSNLDGLRRLGIVLAMDDFGTGYSSLSYLRRLPIQKIKIDRSFVSGMTADSSQAAIIRAIIAMANALGLHTVAEGIETESEAQFLLQEGCHDAQGYLFSQPLPPDELLASWSLKL